MKKGKSHLAPALLAVEQEIGRLLESGLKAHKAGRSPELHEKLARLAELHAAWDQLIKIDGLIEGIAPATEEPQPVAVAQRGVKKAAAAQVAAAEPAAPQEDKEAIRLLQEQEQADARAQREDRRRRKSFQDSSRLFFETTKQLMSEDVWSSAHEAYAKAAIADGRALEAEADAVDPGLRSTILNELDIFGGKWDRLANNKEFFALNLQRQHDANIWRELAEGYRMLADAEECTLWLESRKDIPAQHFNYLFDACAAAESLVDRVMLDHDLGVWDSQQRDIHARLEAIRPEELKTKWWRRIGNDIPSREEMANVARGLKGEFLRIRQGANKTRAKETVVAELAKWLSESVADVNFDNHLLDLVTQAMDDGIPPSDKDLRSMLAGYHYILTGSDNKKVKKLADHLRADAMLDKAKSQEKAVEEEPEANSAELEELLPLTRGKTVLFVGGAKGQGWRKNDYVKSMELADLIWPDAEEQTKPSALATNVEKADIVCLLIRFSRHSFKNVIDEAKTAGKMTAILPRGLGLNTIIHELHSQLVGSNLSKA